jgi:NAD(P)-dependent dehydrogenase (short-subunit alcohol dehydrogenase family)
VVIGARRSESLVSAVEVLHGGDRVTTVASDVSTVAGCRAVVAAALEVFGAIDVLFTNAGVYGTADVEEMSEELWDEIVDSNMKGTFFCVQAALPALRRARGVVITMASDAGRVGVRGGCSAYGAAKAGTARSSASTVDSQRGTERFVALLLVDRALSPSVKCRFWAVSGCLQGRSV